MLTPERRAILPKPAFSSSFCLQAKEKSSLEISYIGGKKIQALTRNETNNMLRVFFHITDVTGVQVKSLYLYLTLKGLCLEIQQQ